VQLSVDELELCSRPWNTIFPDVLIRGDSTVTTLGGGVTKRRPVPACAMGSGQRGQEPRKRWVWMDGDGDVGPISR
jgi:hypothetical protein